MSKSGFIIIQHTLPEKPETLRIASEVGIEDVDTVCGKLARVWSWADKHGHKKNENSDVFVPGATASALDFVTNTPGFGAAMVVAGWLRTTKKGLSFTGLADYSGETAHRRIAAAERKRSQRNRDTVTHRSQKKCDMSREKCTYTYTDTDTDTDTDTIPPNPPPVRSDIDHSAQLGPVPAQPHSAQRAKPDETDRAGPMYAKGRDRTEPARMGANKSWIQVAAATLFLRGFGLSLGDSQIDLQRKSINAVCRKLARLPDRDAKLARAIDLAADKVASDLDNPFAGWQKDMNRTLK